MEYIKLAKRGQTRTKLESEFIKKSIVDFRVCGEFYKIRGGGALRGVPDYVGCVNGYAVFLEYKKDKAEIYKDKGRTKLQEYRMSQVRKNGGYASFIYPQNHDQVLREMKIHCGLITL